MDGCLFVLLLGLGVCQADRPFGFFARPGSCFLPVCAFFPFLLATPAWMATDWFFLVFFLALFFADAYSFGYPGFPRPGCSRLEGSA